MTFESRSMSIPIKASEYGYDHRVKRQGQIKLKSALQLVKPAPLSFLMEYIHI